MEETRLVAGPLRALDTRPPFWVTMFMASAFGANLGDYLAALNSRTVSGAVMAVVCLVALWGDRREGHRTEGWYWVGIIALRAVATNVADALTYDLHLSYPVEAAALGALTLLAGLLTRVPMVNGGVAGDVARGMDARGVDDRAMDRGPSAGSPLVDGWYWVAMALAGVGGTVAGDLMSHTAGLPGSAAVLTALLAVVLVVRSQCFPAALPAYWVAVLAERSAATPVADLLHGRHGLNLRLPVALAITLVTFLALLLLRRRLSGGIDAIRTAA